MHCISVKQVLLGYDVMGQENLLVDHFCKQPSCVDNVHLNNDTSVCVPDRTLSSVSSSGVLMKTLTLGISCIVLCTVPLNTLHL